MFFSSFHLKTQRKFKRSRVVYKLEEIYELELEFVLSLRDYLIYSLRGVLLKRDKPIRLGNDSPCGERGKSDLRREKLLAAFAQKSFKV